jgi:hypothetical protein
MSRKFFLVVALLAVIPCVASAQSDITVEFEGRYWITNSKGKATVADNDIGTDINFKSDLGIKDENYPEGRFTWYTGPNSKIRLAYTQVGYNGDEIVERTIEFGGKTYTVGTRVITDVDVKYLRIGWAWQFINIGKGMVKLGTLLEGKGVWIKASLEAPNLVPSVKESEKLLFGLPTIGIALDINPYKMINIFGEVSGLPAGNYGYMYDGEAGIKFIPIKYFSILGGYRICEIKAKSDTDYAKLTVYGPFVGATLRF